MLWGTRKCSGRSLLSRSLHLRGEIGKDGTRVNPERGRLCYLHVVSEIEENTGNSGRKVPHPIPSACATTEGRRCVHGGHCCRVASCLSLLPSGVAVSSSTFPSCSGPPLLRRCCVTNSSHIVMVHKHTHFFLFVSHSQIYVGWDGSASDGGQAGLGCRPGTSLLLASQARGAT